MIRQAIRFLPRISSHEPETYVDFLLSLCSELKNTASQAMDQAHVQDRTQFSSGMGSAQLCPEDGHITELGSRATNSGIFEIVSQGADRQIFSPNDNPRAASELADLPPSFAPFWNWQDVMSGIFPSLELGSGPVSANFMSENLGPDNTS